MAAVRYKSSLKHIEALLAADGSTIDEQTVHAIEQGFRDLERSAPVVPPAIDDAVENSHDDFVFVHKAAALGKSEMSQS